MRLILEVEFLSGVSFAAAGPDSEEPEWPPQPDRVFSALVATWAAHGQETPEALALEWLERQPPPRLDASGAIPRTAAVVFVPPNDARSDRKAAARGVMPHLRGRQPRRFPAARPLDPTVQFHWEGVDVDADRLVSLQSLARDVAYVGHSASLTRCRFVLDGGGAVERSRWIGPLRCPYPGRMAELRREFEAGRRPQPGQPVGPAVPSAEIKRGALGSRWLFLEHVGGAMPDIRACAVVARAIRDAIISGYEQIGHGALVPEVVSGRTSGREPSRQPHLAVIPLPFVGFPRADGHVMGFAVVPPDGSGILDDSDFLRALGSVAPLDADRARRVLVVRPRSDVAVEFSVALAPPNGPRSMDPLLYTRPARWFGTVTPMALDRHVKGRGDTRAADVKEQVARACGNVGLPAPEVVVADKHSAIEGAASVRSAASGPEWTHWRLTPSLVGRQLTHAVIGFPEEVAGPVILGAGRHFGLGLCRPIAVSEGT